MSSKTLNASVRLNVSQAEKSIDRLVKKINSIDNAINKVGTNNNKVSQQLTKSSNQMNTINSKVRSWANNQRLVTSNLKSTNSVLGAIGSKLKWLASVYLGVMGAKAAITTSDTITSAENKLNYINGYDSNMTQASIDKMYTSANKVRMAYTDMMSNVSKSMVLAGDAFQGNIDNAIRFQEIMSEAYAVGGASAAEQSSSMYQLIQALGSGVLQGDELRSVREGAPLAYKEIEKFAQGVLNSEESLKKLASQGLITSDLVVAAIMNAGDKIDSSFQKTDRTFAQAWNNIKNNAVKAFEPVLQMLNNILNSKAGDAIINGIGYALVFVANALLWVFDLFGRFFNWCAENWDWLRYVAIFAITAILLWLTFLTARALALAAIRLAMWIIEYWQILLIIIAIAAVVAAIIWLANTTADGCLFMIQALALVATAIILIGIITGSTALIIIGIILAVVAFFIACADKIIGATFWLGAVICNIIIGIWNVIVAIGNSVCAIASNIGIAFENAWIWAKNCFWDFVASVLSGISKLEPVINAIASLIGKDGINISGAITYAKGKKSEYKDFVSVRDAWSKGLNTLDYYNLTNAYNKGANIGSNIQDTVGGWGDSIKNKISGLSDFGSLGTMKELGAVLSGGYNPNGLSLPSMDDPANALKTTPSKSPTDLLKGISDDTDSISDAMDLTKEDLEYLRRIADMEWKKEYTTAEIHVDMSNYNTINGDSDLDGIVTKLADKLYDEMNVLANGVYAY